MPIPRHTLSLYDQLDINGTDCISYDEFLEGIKRVAGAGCDRELARHVFELHDTDENQRLQRLEWTHSMHLFEIWGLLSTGDKENLGFLPTEEELRLMRNLQA